MPPVLKVKVPLKSGVNPRKVAKGIAASIEVPPNANAGTKMLGDPLHSPPANVSTMAEAGTERKQSPYSAPTTGEPVAGLLSVSNKSAPRKGAPANVSSAYRSVESWVRRTESRSVTAPRKGAESPRG